MNDTPPDRHAEGGDVGDVVHLATLSPDEEFRTTLRATLAAEAARAPISVLRPNREGRTR